MNKKGIALEITTIVLLIIISLAGVLSIDFSHAYEITNQYGHIVVDRYYICIIRCDIDLLEYTIFTTEEKF